MNDKTDITLTINAFFGWDFNSREMGMITTYYLDGDKLTVLQQAFIDNHGLQCGYCTPGFLMLATNVLEKRPNIGDEELIDVLASNLCRCTGYQNIIKAVKAARDQLRKP